MSTAVQSQRRLPCRIARTIVASVSLVRILVRGLAPSADLVRVEPNEALAIVGMTVSAAGLVDEALAVLGAAATGLAAAVTAEVDGTDKAQFLVHFTK